MTQDEIIELAKQAGFLTNEIKSYVISPYNFEDQDLYEELEAFAKLVAAKEQEAIIDLVAFYGGPVDLEAAIRARGEA